MHVAELERIEESVQKSSAKIVRLEGYLAHRASFTTRWASPLAEISSLFKDAQSALDEFCGAHRQAVKSVKTQDGEVRQQNKERADELRAKHEGLDEKEEKLRDGVRELRKGRRS